MSDLSRLNLFLLPQVVLGHDLEALFLAGHHLICDRALVVLEVAHEGIARIADDDLRLAATALGGLFTPLADWQADVVVFFVT